MRGIGGATAERASEGEMISKIAILGLYVLLIVAVNFGFSVVPLVALPWGDMFPPMALVVGFIFVVRDFAQRKVGQWVIPAMLVGGIISYFMADPFVAIASVTAFLVSEAFDWAVYTWTKTTFHHRILISSAVSTPVDSAIFLQMIGHFSWSGAAIMTASKMLAALAIWAILRRRCAS